MPVIIMMLSRKKADIVFLKLAFLSHNDRDYGTKKRVYVLRLISKYLNISVLKKGIFFKRGLCVRFTHKFKFVVRLILVGWISDSSPPSLKVVVSAATPEVAPG